MYLRMPRNAPPSNGAHVLRPPDRHASDLHPAILRRAPLPAREILRRRPLLQQRLKLDNSRPGRRGEARKRLL